jgi:ATP-dependent Lon protease
MITVIIPKDNEKDLAEVPADVLELLQVNPVDTMDEVLQIALDRAPTPRPDANLDIPVWQQPAPGAGATDGSVTG